MSMKCEKRKHRTLAEAMIAIRRQPRKALAPYFCKLCSAYHLTHSKRDDVFQRLIDRVRKEDNERRS
jgi:hypothetical protein